MGKWGPQCHTVVDVRAQWMGPFVRVRMCVCVRAHVCMCLFLSLKKVEDEPSIIILYFQLIL